MGVYVMKSAKYTKSRSDIVIITEIEDVRLTSALDVGFSQEFQLTAETHSHTFFELFITIGGKLCLETLDKDNIMMTEGSFCLIRPSVYHNTKAFTDDAKKLAIRFQLDKIYTPSEKCCLYDRISATLDTLPPISFFHDCEDIYSDFCSLRSELLHPSTASDACVSALLTHLYVCLFRKILSTENENFTLNDTDPDLSAERKLKIEEYLFFHFKDSITEDDMARDMCLSKRQLNRVLKSIYGIGFRRLLMDVRLHRAAQLLTETSISINEICAEIGYTSISGFYSAFSQKFGISAGKYRKKFRNQDTSQ